MTDKERELLNKIKALVEGGIAGEKIAAEKQLKKMMKKLGISESDLEVSKNQKYVIKFKRGKLYGKKLLFQVVANVLQEKWYSADAWYDNDGVTIICAPEEYIEMVAKYEFYLKKLQKKIELLYQAFVQKNDLGRCAEPGSDLFEDKKIDSEMLALYSSIDKEEYLTQLEFNKVGDNHNE